MTNNTEVYWDVNGVSLQTLAKDILVVSGGYSPPGFRGGNRVVSYKHGNVWREKYADARDISLGMVILGVDDDGVKTSKGFELEFWKNLKDLQQLVWNDNSHQVELTKRWYDYDTGAVKSATTLAEYVGGLDPSFIRPDAARVVLDFNLSDPFFYGPEITESMVINTPTVITNKGDAVTSRIKMRFNDNLSNPVITNSSMDPVNWMKIGTNLAAGDLLDVDVEKFSVTRASDGSSLAGSVTRSGARPWFNLVPGDNTVELTTDSGAGSIDITYQEAYF